MAIKKIEGLLRVRNELRKDRENAHPLSEFGDFTYGFPEIISWDNQTKVSIGKFCSIGGNVRIFLGGNHRNDWISTYPFNSLINEYSYIKGHPFSKGDINIGNDVWIGNGVTILSGVKIGNGVSIGANSVVSKDIPDYAIAIGNPARIVKYKYSTELIQKLLEIKWWDWSVSQISESVELLQSNNLEQLIRYYEKIK